jgi:hypothetical protein
MKKIAFALILAVVAAALYGQSGPKDLILLLDTSASMSGSYQEVNNYLSGAFLSDNLRIGDTFHLIPFSDKARVDLARRVEGRGELETLIGRFFLQYPLDAWSDIPAALAFAEGYSASLPARPKKIVLVTDGNISLPPGSASRSFDQAGFDSFLSETSTRLSKQGVSLEYKKVVPGQALSPARQQAPAPVPKVVETPPPPKTAEPLARPANPPEASRPQAAVTGAQPALPPPAGRPQEALPVEQPNESAIAELPDYSGEVTEATAEGEGAMEGEPESAIEGETEASDTDGVEQPPYTEPVYIEENNISPPMNLFIILGIIGLAALILTIVFISREMHGSPSRAMARAAAAPSVSSEPAPFTDHSKDLAKYAEGMSKQRSTPYSDRHAPIGKEPVNYKGPVLLNLFVEDQNTFIGKRNIHSVKPGNSFTVGGGASDFLIFLVPIPPAIGEIRNEGNGATFIPRKPQYFPDIGSQPVRDCVGKTIRIVSDKKYELKFRFEHYEDPLAALNRLLNSVKIPG